MNDLFKDIKWIFFDVGFTLVDETGLWLKRCEEQSGLIRIQEEPLPPERIYEEILAAAGDYRPDYRALMSSLGYIEYAPYRKEYEKPEPEAPGVVKELSERYSLGIIANQSEGLIDRLTAWGMIECFKVIVSSHEAGVSKPDPVIFDTALKQAGCLPGEAVMIGDRLDNDIYPANNAGMKTVRILKGTCVRQKPLGKEYVPDAEVSSLTELKDIFL